MTDTKGYIYFAIKTDNDSCDREWFERHLTLRPTQFQKKYERGKVPTCTTWKYSTPELTNALYSYEIKKLVEFLEPYKEVSADTDQL